MGNRLDLAASVIPDICHWQTEQARQTPTFKLDFPGNFWLAALAILVMFYSLFNLTSCDTSQAPFCTMCMPHIVSLTDTLRLCCVDPCWILFSFALYVQCSVNMQLSLEFEIIKFSVLFWFWWYFESFLTKTYIHSKLLGDGPPPN